MLIYSLENTKVSHLVGLGHCNRQEGVELYGQLPDCGDFQCYDFGQGGILQHVAQRIYANFQNPSWETLKHHFLPANAPRGIFRELKSIARNDKRAISNKNEFLEE